MATEFLMPKLGLTMESGTIVDWLVDDGADVVAGMAVLAIETDKTETEVEASAAGRLHRSGEVGETYDCGAVIGWLLEEGEAPPAERDAPPAAEIPASEAPPANLSVVVAPTNSNAPGSGRLIASPNARRVASELGIDLRHVRGTGPGGRIVAADVTSSSPPRSELAPVSVPGSRVVPASIAARNLADLLGVDLGEIPADPVERRVTREGVAMYVRDRLAAAPDAPPGPDASARSASPLLQEPTKVVPFRGIRGTIARRMRESLDEMAQLSLFMDADLSGVRADRERRGPGAPGYTDYVVAAVARSLLAHPMFNSQVAEDGISLLSDVHVGVAVAIEGGVVVPVVRDAARLDLSSIASESRRLIESARSGQIQLADLEGGTCSVTSLGMFGVDGFTPIINPPNAAIVGVGRLRQALELADDGTVSAHPVVTLSLTWDHRVADGAPAAEFCRSIVDYLARPEDLDAAAGL